MLKMEFAAVVTRGVNATDADPPITAEPAVEPLPDADWVICAPATIIIIAVTFAF